MWRAADTEWARLSGPVEQQQLLIQEKFNIYLKHKSQLYNILLCQTARVFFVDQINQSYKEKSKGKGKAERPIKGKA